MGSWRASRSIAASREQDSDSPLQSPASGLLMIPASGTVSGTAKPILQISVRVPAGDRVGDWYLLISGFSPVLGLVYDHAHGDIRRQSCRSPRARCASHGPASGCPAGGVRATA